MPLICHRARVLQRFMDTAIDLRQLFRSKEGIAGNEAGAGGKVLLGSGVTVHTAVGTVVISLEQFSK